MPSSSPRPPLAAVPFLDLVVPHQQLKAELLDVLRRALGRAALVGGSEVEGCAKEFAVFAGAQSCVGVNSGTDALRFAYQALGTRPRHDPEGRSRLWSAISTDRSHWQFESELMGAGSDLSYAALADEHLMFLRKDAGGVTLLAIATVGMP